MTPSPENIDIDSLLHGLKDFGRFQMLQYMAFIIMLIPSATILLEVVFLGYRPGYQCSNLTSSQLLRYNASDIVYQKCAIELHMNPNESSLQSETIPCVNGLDFSGPKYESIVSEWDLVCVKDGLADLTHTLFTVGECIGALLFPSLSDRIGRKPVHVGCGFVLFLVATGCSLAPYYWVFALLRCLSGIFLQGMLVPSFTLSMEAFPANRRTLMACLACIWWGVCVTILGPLAYAVRLYSWRVLAAIVGCTAAFSVIEFWFVHESVRWLFANNQIDRGKRILQHAARVNGVDFDSLWIKCMELLEETSSGDKEATNSIDEVTSNTSITSRHNSIQIQDKMILAAQPYEASSNIAVINLMRNSHTRKLSFVIQYSWLILCVTYFGLYLTSSSLSGDRYTNYFLTALMEIPGTVVLMKTFIVYGRKKSIVGMMMTAAVSMILVSIFKAVGKSHSLDIASTVFSLLGMAGISGAFSGMWLYTPEVFPTNLRSAAMGLAAATARVGSMVSPYIRILAIYAPWAPGLIFGVGCLIACWSFHMLPETHNRQLPQTMKQMEELRKYNKEKRIGKKKKKLKSIIYTKHPLAESRHENSSENEMVPTDF